MKTITKTFIIAEGLDLLTTITGIIFLNLWDANPLQICFTTIICKIVITVIVAWILQIKAKHSVYWIIPSVAVLPVIWNIFVIVFELIS